MNVFLCNIVLIKVSFWVYQTSCFQNEALSVSYHLNEEVHYKREVWSKYHYDDGVQQLTDTLRDSYYSCVDT